MSLILPNGELIVCLIALLQSAGGHSGFDHGKDMYLPQNAELNIKHGAPPDPTTVCMPYMSETFVRNMDTGTVSYKAYDYIANKIALMGVNHKHNISRDWNTLISCSASGDGKYYKCKVSEGSPYPGYLKEYSKFLGYDMNFGLDGALLRMAWEVTQMGRKLRCVFSSVEREPTVVITRDAPGGFTSSSQDFSDLNSTILRPELFMSKSQWVA